MSQNIVKLVMATTFGLFALGVVAPGNFSAAWAAKPCKKNCKVVFKACKADVKAALLTAKSHYKAVKAVCKASFGEKADRKACAANAKNHLLTIKHAKRASIAACKSRMKEVQIPGCIDLGLLDACSPAGGFTDGMSSSLF